MRSGWPKALTGPQLTKVPPDTHKQTKQERPPVGKPSRRGFRTAFHSDRGCRIEIRHGFWPLETTINGCRESSVFRYYADNKGMWALCVPEGQFVSSGPLGIEGFAAKYATDY